MIRLKKIIQLKEQEQPSSHLTAEDISYFKEQIANMLTSLDEMHQEIGTNIQMANDETGYDIYKEMDAQISRYIESSKKSLEYCDKYLTRIAPRLERL
jgi:hypothetical protein